MPVRFACPKCQSRLSVGRRKIGTETECPRCGRLLIVPTEEDAAAGLVLADIAHSGAAEPDVEAIPEFVVYDDIPNLVESPPTITPSGMPAAVAALDEDGSRPPMVESNRAGPPLERRRLPPEPGAVASMFLISRRVLYVQAALLLVVALGAFAAGYFTGRGDSGSAQDTTAEGPVDPVVVEGKLVFAAPTGEVTGDSGSVIVALPVGKSPATKIEASALGPRLPELAPDAPQIAAIEQLGGSYLRADDEGGFSLVVPRPGRYYVLLVSRETDRPTSQPVDRNDIIMLAQYFARPTDLLGSRKYRLDQWMLDGDTPHISHNFGLAGR